MMPRPTAPDLREVYSDFNDFERCTDGTVRIALGPDPLSIAFQPLTDVREGERVRVVLPDELEAEGVLECEAFESGPLWFAVLTSWEAIRNIHPEALAGHDQAEEMDRKGAHG